MNIKNLLKRIIDPNHYSSEAYIQYLRNSGVHIGEKTIVYAPIFKNHILFLLVPIVK